MFTWTLFLPIKNNPFKALRSYHGGEFQNEEFDFFQENDINHNISTPKIPQQNGVMERKNRSLEELAMFCAKKWQGIYW